MTTTRQDVPTDPTAVSGLTDDTTYLLEAQGSRRVAVATAEDARVLADGPPAVSLGPGQRLRVTKTADTDVYVWAERAGSQVVLDDQLSP